MLGLFPFALWTLRISCASTVASVKASEAVWACIAGRSAAASRALKSATADELQAWQRACELHEEVEFGTASFRRLQGVEAQIASTMTTCTTGLAASDAKDIASATDAVIAAWQTSCEATALQNFVAAGWKEQDFAFAESKGAQSTLATAMSACVQAQSSADGNSDAEILGFQRSCDVQVKTAFVAAGGVAAAYALAKATGADAALAGAMQVCVSDAAAAAGVVVADATNAKVTDWQKQCSPVARTGFLAAGGKPQFFDVGRRNGAASSSAVSMGTCVHSMAVQTGTDEADAPDALLLSWQQTCAEPARQVFVAAGGRPEDIDYARRWGAESAVAASVAACVMRLAGHNSSLEDALSVESWQNSCAMFARTAFLRAGGQPDDFDLARRLGAARRTNGRLAACVQSLWRADVASALNVSLWQRACVPDARVEFLAAGGKSSSFELALLRGAESDFADQMSACVAALAADSDILTESALQMLSWQKVCDARAFISYPAPHGLPLELGKRRGAETLVADRMVACVTGLALNANVPLSNETAIQTFVPSWFATQLEVWQKMCSPGAEREFLSAGGQLGDFELAKRRGAVRRAAEQMAACVDGLATSVGEYVYNTSDYQLNVWQMTCAPRARTAFLAAGGSKWEYEVARRRGAANRAADQMFACTYVQAANGSQDINLTDVAVEKLQTKCAVYAKVELLASGGRPNDWELSKREGAESKATDTMSACVYGLARATANDSNATVDEAIRNATTADLIAWKNTCSLDASLAFVAAGGTRDYFELALFNGGSSDVADRMIACVNALACDALGFNGSFYKPLRNATSIEMEVWQKTCTIGAKTAFSAVGGHAEEFELARQRGAESRGAEQISLCVFGLAMDAIYSGWVLPSAIQLGSAKEMTTWRKTCAVDAATVFQAAGGKLEDFEVGKTKGVALQVADRMSACLLGLAANVSKAVKDSTPLQVEAWQRMCSLETRAQFLNSGGNADDFEIAKLNGAELKGTDEMVACVRGFASSLSKVIGDATAFEILTWQTSCAAVARLLFASSGAQTDNWEAAKRKSAASRAADQMSACVNGLARDANLYVNNATPVQIYWWKTMCEVDAKASFLMAGGQAEDWELAKREGATVNSANQMSACVYALATQENRSVKGSTVLQLSKWQNICKVYASSAFLAAGGKSEDFELCRRRGADAKGADKMRACVWGLASDLNKYIRNATALDIAVWQKACIAGATTEFLAAGGSPEAFEVAARKAAEYIVANQMIGCVSGLSANAGTTVQIAPPVDVRAWQLNCTDPARTEYLAAGGKSEDFELARTRGAQWKSADSMIACVSGIAASVSKDLKTATAFLIYSWQKICAIDAAMVFSEAGGRLEVYELAKRKGAESKSVERMSACVYESAASINQEVKNATDVQIDAWQKACAVIARWDFLGAGGQPEDFELARRQGAESAAADRMVACVDWLATNASRYVKNATGTLIDWWQRNCTVKAQIDFLSAGGALEDFELGKQHGAESRGADQMISCVGGLARNALKELNSGVSDAEMEAWQRRCAVDATSVFRAAGCRLDDLALAKRNGAESKVADYMGACIGSYVLTLGKTLRSTLPALFEPWHRACAANATFFFQAAGGREENFELAMRRGAESRGAGWMTACVYGSASVAKGYLRTATSSQVDGWRKLCETDAKLAFIAAGGWSEEWEFSKRRGAQAKGADQMWACVRAWATNVSISVRSWTGASLDVWQRMCRVDANISFVAAGGDPNEIEFAQLKGPESLCVDSLGACVNELATNESKYVKSASASDVAAWVTRCAVDANVSFLAAGGKAQDFDMARQDGAESSVADRMTACANELARNASKVLARATDAELAAWQQICAASARTELLSLGGRADAFPLVLMNGAQYRGAELMNTCVKALAATVGRSVQTASDLDVQGWWSSCTADVRRGYVAAGGVQDDFDLALLRGAESRAADGLRACVQALATSARVDVRSAPTYLIERWQQSCAADALADYRAAGGSAEQWNSARLTAAESKGNDVMLLCVDNAAKAEGKSVVSAPSAERLAWAAACNSAAQTEFAVAGGDVQEWPMAQRKAAEAKAATTLTLCLKAVGDAANSSSTPVTDMVITRWVSACQAQSRADFEASGGSAAPFAWYVGQQRGAAARGCDTFSVCLQRAARSSMQTLSLASPQAVSIFKTQCQPQAQAEFAAAGGNTKVFDTSLEQCRRPRILDALASCLSAASGDAAALAACDVEVKEVALSLGADLGRLDREKQDARREDLAIFRSMCLDAGGDATSCLSSAQTRFVALGGSLESFQQENRLGAGGVAVVALQACYQTADLKSQKLACAASACQAQGAAGGNVSDCWFDRRMGMMRWALDKFLNCQANFQTNCISVAYAFFVDALGGEVSDWNADDFLALVGNAASVTTPAKIPSVDGRFQLLIDGKTSAEVKYMIDSKKFELEQALKSAVAAAKVSCSDSSAFTTQANVVCRMTFRNMSSATLAEAKLRHGDLDIAVATVTSGGIGAPMRVLGSSVGEGPALRSGRRLGLQTIVTSEGSQVYGETPQYSLPPSIVVVETTVPPSHNATPPALTVNHGIRLVSSTLPLLSQIMLFHCVRLRLIF